MKLLMLLAVSALCASGQGVIFDPILGELRKKDASSGTPGGTGCPGTTLPDGGAVCAEESTNNPSGTLTTRAIFGYKAGVPVVWNASATPETICTLTSGCGAPTIPSWSTASRGMIWSGMTGRTAITKNNPTFTSTANEIACHVMPMDSGIPRNVLWYRNAGGPTANKAVIAAILDMATNNFVIQARLNDVPSGQEETMPVGTPVAVVTGTSYASCFVGEEVVSPIGVLPLSTTDGTVLNQGAAYDAGVALGPRLFKCNGTMTGTGATYALPAGGCGTHTAILQGPGLMWVD